MLEHSTIPAYLYSWYSVKPGKNKIAANLILSVLKEEMLHFVLAMNLLKAIGGSPQLNTIDFIPQYPSLLPGVEHNGLIVGLKPLSKQLVKDVFMEIEEPEKPLDFPVVAAFEDGLQSWAPKTIGQFYERIKQEIIGYGDAIFDQTGKGQIVAGAQLPGAIAVTNVETAIAAIEIIVEQGEGTQTDPGEDQDHLAHYYKFAEIYNGKRLIKDPMATPLTPADRRYIYAGTKIPLDQDGIYPLKENPKESDYEAGSQAREAVEEFNAAYTTMLRLLHAASNDDPNQIGPSIDIMKLQLSPLAREIVKMQISETLNAGPTFQFKP